MTTNDPIRLVTQCACVTYVFTPQSVHDKVHNKDASAIFVIIL